MAQLFDTIETPAVLIDIDRVENNLGRAQAYANSHGIDLRPHIKTHKIPGLARRQMALGAVGITVQKLGEGEVMADAGIEDILLPYNLVGRDKLVRLLALSRRTRLSVTADSRETVDGYSDVFARAGETLTVLVECDTGMGRCGVQSPEEALALAEVIENSPGLRFGGLMTYPPHGRVAEVELWLASAVSLFERNGLPPAVVTSGGTPDLYRAHEVAAATEHRPGTYIYLDRYQVAKGVGGVEDCALTVLATVVSRPTADRAILDAGSKALTSDTLGMAGHGLITQYPEAVINGLSEEHGHVDLSASTAKPRIGERVRVIPNHACVVSNLFDKVYFISGDRIVDAVQVAARGAVT
jgi:D-serine deaminase-like pyridoxal phosphate-dependent protein